MMRRRPLMRGAMVGGIGYAAGRSGARRAEQEEAQEQRLASLENQQAPAPAPAAPAAAAASPGESTIDQLQKLAQLRDSGVLTNDEFEAQKQKILAGG